VNDSEFEMNLLINSIESAIDICKAVGQDPTPFINKLQEIIIIPAEEEE
jgi:hypothetical protein